MPFHSQAQRRWMYATHPEMAKRWDAETPKTTRQHHMPDQKTLRREALITKMQKGALHGPHR